MKTSADKGKLFIISAPSGCGKTTLCKKLLEDDLGLVHSTSATTRPPRSGEKNGVDYHFLSEKKFEEMAEAGAFLEYEKNFGYSYGTPKKAIEKDLKKGRSILLSIDVKGAMRIKRIYPDDSVLIFILPPSITALKKRLLSRRSDGEDAISTRLNLAKKEMEYKDRYQYRIVNDRLDTAYRKLKNIILDEIRQSCEGKTGGGTCTICR
ncbi:MAG: guanylate kinase [Candidatus Omnitrophota bacterium]|jgi:guanylate kinase